MGAKGVQISVGLIALGTLCLLVSLFLSWQHTSVLGSAIEEHVVTVDVAQSLLVRMIPEKFKEAHHGFKGTLVQCRELTCGLVTSKLAVVLCRKFTMDMVVGIFICILFSMVAVLELVAGLYLMYYKSGRSKKEYRKIAFRCLVVCPCLIFMAIFAYMICLFDTLTMDLPLHIIQLPLVVTPGGGFFLAFFAFFILSFVPCLSRQWMLSRGEMMDSERRNYKKEAMGRMVWEQNYNGGGVKSAADVSSGAPYFDNFNQSHNAQDSVSFQEPFLSGTIPTAQPYMVQPNCGEVQLEAYSGAPQYPPCAPAYPSHEPPMDPYANNMAPTYYPSVGPEPVMNHHQW